MSSANELAPLQARKGLKLFECVMYQMFSSSTSTSSSSSLSQHALKVLSPQYTDLPPFLTGVGKQKLLQTARKYWNERGLTSDDKVEESFDNVTHRDECKSMSPWPFDEQTALPSIGCVRRSHKKRDTNNPLLQTRKTITGKDIGGVGDILNHERARRKEVQLANLIQCVLSLLPYDNWDDDSMPFDRTTTPNFRIVDFAGGTGHLAVPLALLLPHCEVVCVDLKKWSLDLLKRRVDGSTNADCINQNDNPVSNDTSVSAQSNTIQASLTLPNLFTYHGSIQSYPHSFDIGISLHACGEASDWVLRKCLHEKASWVICSCCCGKLREQAKNPYVFQSTGDNKKKIQYPQSTAFASLGASLLFCNDVSQCSAANDTPQQLTPAMFDAIARAADFCGLEGKGKLESASHRVAKALVEWDRLQFAKEYMAREEIGNNNGGDVVLTKMLPYEAGFKNDILIGWCKPMLNPYDKRGNPSTGYFYDSIESFSSSLSLPRDKSFDSDFNFALEHLFVSETNNLGIIIDTSSSAVVLRAYNISEDENDWTADEVAEIQSQLEFFLQRRKCSIAEEDTVPLNWVKTHDVTDERIRADCFRFPTGMGARRRKLVHHVAEIMGLNHWSEGKKSADKTVVVAVRRRDLKNK